MEKLKIMVKIVLTQLHSFDSDQKSVFAVFIFSEQKGVTAWLNWGVVVNELITTTFEMF